MLLCCWWCLRPEAVELDSRRVDSRRVDHRVLNCEATASTAITAVSLDQWEPETTNTALQPSQRSADCCSWGALSSFWLSRKLGSLFGGFHKFGL